MPKFKPGDRVRIADVSAFEFRERQILEAHPEGVVIAPDLAHSRYVHVALDGIGGISAHADRVLFTEAEIEHVAPDDVMPSEIYETLLAGTYLLEAMDGPVAVEARAAREYLRNLENVE